VVGFVEELALTDIVERLRKVDTDLCAAAADEIETLRAEIVELRAELDDLHRLGSNHT
jgi:hypothetical protein